jgi:hypothetical protein
LQPANCQLETFMNYYVVLARCFSYGKRSFEAITVAATAFRLVDRLVSHGA